MRYNILVSAERPGLQIVGTIFKEAAQLSGSDEFVTDKAVVQELFDELQEVFLQGAVEHMVVHVERSPDMLAAETVLRKGFYMADDCALTLALMEVE